MTMMLRLCFPLLAAGATSLLLASCRQYAPINELSFELILAPERNLSALDIAHGDTSQQVRLTDIKTLSCTGANEFKEYNPNAKVIIRDDKNRQIGAALLGQGKIASETKSKTGISVYRGCKFKTAIHLSGPSRVYRLDIANGKHKDYLHISSLTASGRNITIDLD
jgi:hypothetical protein